MTGFAGRRVREDHGDIFSVAIAKKKSDTSTRLTEMYSPRKEALVRRGSPSPLRRGDQEPRGSG